MLAPAPADESGKDDDGMLPVPLFPRGLRWRWTVVKVKSGAHRLVLFKEFPVAVECW